MPTLPALLAAALLAVPEPLLIQSVQVDEPLASKHDPAGVARARQAFNRKLLTAAAQGQLPLLAALRLESPAAVEELEAHPERFVLAHRQDLDAPSYTFDPRAVPVHLRRDGGMPGPTSVGWSIAWSEVQVDPGAVERELSGLARAVAARPHPSLLLATSCQEANGLGLPDPADTLSQVLPRLGWRVTQLAGAPTPEALRAHPTDLVLAGALCLVQVTGADPFEQPLKVKASLQLRTPEGEVLGEALADEPFFAPPGKPPPEPALARAVELADGLALKGLGRAGPAQARGRLTLQAHARTQQAYQALRERVLAQRPAPTLRRDSGWARGQGTLELDGPTAAALARALSGARVAGQEVKVLTVRQGLLEVELGP